MVCGIEPSAHHALFPPGGRAGDTPPFRLELPPIPEDHYSPPELMGVIIRNLPSHSKFLVGEPQPRQDQVGVATRPTPQQVAILRVRSRVHLKEWRR